MTSRCQEDTDLALKDRVHNDILPDTPADSQSYTDNIDQEDTWYNCSRIRF